MLYVCKPFSFERQCKLYNALDILFGQISTFIKDCVAFIFGLQTFWLIGFSKIYQLKGLEPKDKGLKQFYELCDSTKNIFNNAYIGSIDVMGVEDSKDLE